MKNVTIALDDETHRRARIRAAELGTSLSALVKDYLTALAGNDAAAPPFAGVREMPLSYNPEPALSGTSAKPKILRQPGGLRGKIGMADDFEVWPDDILASFEAWDYGDASPRKS